MSSDVARRTCAAGAHNAPALLPRSGRDHPHLGKHVRLQPATPVAGSSKEPMGPTRGPLADRAAAVVDGDGAKVIIVASPAISTYLVPPALFAVLRDHPRAAITSKMEEPRCAVQSLVRGECDLVLVPLEGIAPLGVTVDHVHREPTVLIAGGDDCDLPATLELAQIAELTVVGALPDVVPQRRLKRQLRHESTELRTVMSLGHPEAIKAAVAENGWVAFLPLCAVEADLASGRLRHVTVTDFDVADEIGLLHRDDKSLSPLQRTTLRALGQALVEREARGFAGDRVLA